MNSRREVIKINTNLAQQDQEDNYLSTFSSAQNWCFHASF